MTPWKHCTHDPAGGSCYVCAPWMFPNGNEQAKLAYLQWHLDNDLVPPRHWVQREWQLIRQMAAAS